MGAWGLPLAAGSFWLGLLAWDARPAAVRGFPSWVWLAIGVAGLIAAGVAAPARRRGDPITELGLAPAAGGRPGPALALLTVAVLTTGMGWGGVAEHRRESSFLAGLTPRSADLVGTLREDPEVSAFGWHALVDVTSATWSGGSASLRETVWVGGQDELPDAVRGDAVALAGRLELPDDAGFADTLHRRGISVAVRADQLTRTGPSPNPFVHLTQVIRGFVGATIERIFPPREAGLLLGLVLGDDSKLDPATTRDFHATGLGHLLVVSGENVAMVLAPVLAFAGVLRLARVGRFVLGLGTVLLFVVLTGAEPSVLRAGAMATLALLGVLLGKPRATGVLLAGAVLILLVLDPWLVHAIGFQLSVAATAGMVTLASPIADRLARIVPKPVALAAGTTMAAQLGVTPLLLFHFHDVPVVTIVANVAAFPAVSPALLLGIAASALGLVWIPLGRVIVALALAPMRYLEFVANVFAKAPVPHITSNGGPAVLLVGAAVFVAIALGLRSGWRPSRRVTTLIVVVFPLLIWTTATAKGPPSSLTVRFFDVGQGDSALVTSPAGASILIDGGPDDEQVATYLAGVGMKRLDVVVASHPHADHIIGLPAVFAEVQVGVVLEPGCPDDSSLLADLDRAIADEGLSVLNSRVGDAFTVGDLRVDVLSPDRCWSGTNSDPNNDAIVLRIALGEDVVLIASEPEVDAQRVLLDEGVDLHADVLKVPHHGAATSLPEFFQAVDATVAVVSVGENTYGHPVPATLDAIAETGAKIWRTDQHGTVTVTFQDHTPVVASDR